LHVIEDQFVCAWEGNSNVEATYSITKYVEENSKRIRGKYISFIHDLGQTVFDGKRLVEHMEIKPGLSLWWMSLLAEKSSFKSPHIVDCLKLIALEEILQSKRLDAIKVLGVGEGKIARAIEILCRDNNISLTIERKPTKLPSVFQVRRLYHMLPHFMQGLISLMFYTVRCWSLRTASKPSKYNNGNGVLICSYFDNFNSDDTRGRFMSNYWTELPALLEELDKKTIWIHKFIKTKQIPDPSSALHFLKRFNSNIYATGSHHFIDGQVSINLITRTICIWLKMLTMPIKLKRIEQTIQKHRPATFLWPLLKDDWKKSTCGATAIHNALTIELYDATLRQFPRQKMGFYLHEGQGWERAFIHAWRKYGHGELIAVAHTPSRFWIFGDLIHPRDMADETPQAMPVPDRIAVNGPAAKDAFIEAGFSSNDLVSVEALRYLGLGLNELKARKPEKHAPLTARRLLVLGDITPIATRAMLQTLDSLPEAMLSKMKIIVKPHPNNPVKKSDYPDLQFTLIDVPLSDIFNEVDIVYGASPTSANLDAFLVGVPVIVHQAEGQLNFSPLRGQTGVRFVSGAEELESTLKNIPIRNAAETEKYFWLDRELPRWRELLGNSSEG
jgi:surface carbohydrate biosynthesis protein (TIGR04326 family)